MGILWQDLRYSLRALSRHLGFTLIVTLILGLGIGASTAIFSFVNGVLLRPLPFPEPDRLVVLKETNPQKGQNPTVVSPRNLEDWEERSQTIEQFGAWRDWGFTLSTPEGPEGVRGGIASPDLFRLLEVKPVSGRTFLPEENRPGRDRVVLLSYSLWQRRFGGDQSIIGQALSLSHESYTVIGVLPPDLEPLTLGQAQIWAPLSVDPDQTKGRHLRNRQVYARLKRGVTQAHAQAEMNSIAAALAQEYPKENAGWGVSIISLHEDEVGSVRSALLVFLGAVGLVLLIACANVANLLLARATGRRKELAIRAALGAGRFRMARMLMTESLVLALVGGVAGVMLALWLVELFLTLSPVSIPRAAEVKVDGIVLGFTFLVTMLTGVLFGLVPGLYSSRIDLVQELKDEHRGALRGIGFHLRGLLVISQVSLAVILLIGAGLLSQTFVRLTTLQPGFNPDNLLTVQVYPPLAKYPERSQVAALYQQITQELRSIPGVVSVGATSSSSQFGGYEPIEFLAEGQAAPSSGQFPQARFFDVGEHYFHTMEVPVRQGREFADHDNANAPLVAIINETFARLHFPNENPLGKRLTLVRYRPPQTLEVVGVVGDMRRFGLGARVEPEIYWPYLQQPRWATFFVIRASSDPASLISAVRRRISGIDKDVLISNLRTLDQLVTQSLQRPRFNMLLLGIFAAVALLLAAAGIYGVMSYTVAQNTREIGIRMALGAQAGDIRRLIVGQGLILTLIGVTIGVAAALALTRLMSNLLYGVSATDPATFALIVLLLAAVALLACYLPARRATKVEPMIALRSE
jgi:putative ABC transport system permease protein